MGLSTVASAPILAGSGAAPALEAAGWTRVVMAADDGKEGNGVAWLLGMVREEVKDQECWASTPATSKTVCGAGVWRLIGMRKRMGVLDEL